MIYNRNIYTLNKSNVANFMNLINKYHHNPEIKITIDKNTVTLCVVSSATLDFYKLLPKINKHKIKLTENQTKIADLINNYLHNKLKNNTSTTIKQLNFPQIKFKELLEISYNLIYVSKLLINNNDIYIGIGSDKLGYYVMELTNTYIKELSCPKFNINKGFIDPFYDIYTEDSINSKNRFSFLNETYFNVWQQKNLVTDISRNINLFSFSK